MIFSEIVGYLISLHLDSNRLDWAKLDFERQNMLQFTSNMPIKISRADYITMIPLCMKPLRRRAGRRWGYSSVDVTLTFHTCFHAE